MTVSEIGAIAKRRGLKAGKLRKVDLVRAIQTAEGNPACFRTGESARCGQETCLWRADCD